MNYRLPTNLLGPVRVCFAERRNARRSAWLVSALLWLCCSLGLTLHSLAAESPEEAKAFKAAVLAYDTQFYERAESAFADFLQQFPNSDRVPEVTLLRAQALAKLKNYPGALELISQALARAGALADQYRLFLAETQLQTSNYVAAAGAFAALLNDSTNSTSRLRAAYGEALSRFKLRDWSAVIDLLRNPDRAFQKIATVRTNELLVVQGQVLLVEALLEARDVRGAQETLGRLNEPTPTRELDWRVQFLRCRTLLASGRAADARAATTNLLATATATGQRRLVAESVALQGDILGQLGEYDAAVAAYEMNQVEGTPLEQQRLAVLRIVELFLAQNRNGEASKRLEAFSSKYTNDVAADLALLTLGELQLKEHYLRQEATPKPETPDTPKSATNLVEQALAQFDKLLKDFPQSPWSGKAQLNRGWCFWVLEKISESQLAFQAATNLLSYSEDQAVARFKLADAEFEQNDLTNAFQNYRLVLRDYAGWPRVRDELFDHALYQILLISVTLGDESAANEAMNRIVQIHPRSRFASRSVLLLGQANTRWHKPEQARSLLFEQFVSKFPNDPLVPQVLLAIARAYVDEQNWDAAIKAYEEVAVRFPSADVRPEAEYYHALMISYQGKLTNALSLLTNFVVQFPTNKLAPLAQFWVADFFWNQKNFFQAQKEYQRLFENTNWPISELTYQARLMAGQSALALQGYKVADTLFTDLINVLLADTNSSPGLLAEAWLKLGDTITEGSRLDPAKPLDSRFGEAINAFMRIIQGPTNRCTAMAWGRIGDCHFQLGGQSPDRYTNAIAAYQNALFLGGVGVRSQAEVGWGLALEKMAEKKTGSEREALSKEALNRHLNVALEQNLRPGEKLDPFWFRRAVLEAARLAEANRQWRQAIKLYERLIDALPVTKASLQRRIEAARRMESAERN